MTRFELVLRTLAALWLFAAHLYVTLRATLALRLGRSIFLSAAAFFTVGLCGAALFFHLLMVVHLYTLPGALALSSLACALAAWSTRTAGATADALSRIVRTRRRLWPLLMRSPHRGRVYFFVATTLPLALRTLLFVPNSHDTVVYHATKAALWVQQNDLGAMWGPGQWELYGLFPGGAELFCSLVMLPFRGDLLACLVDTAMWLGLGFASLALQRELGVREPYASIGAGFLLNVPTFRLLVGSGYIEPTLCFAFVLGAYFVMRYLRTAHGPLALLAVAALGVAASTKFSIMVPAAVGGTIVLIRGLYTRGRRLSALAWTLGGTALALFVIAPWVLNSLKYTGYPLSPMPLKVAGLTLGVSRNLELFTRTAVYPKPFVWENEWPLVKITFALPDDVLRETVGVFSALPVVLAPLGWLSLALRRPWRALALMLLSTACAWTFLEPHMAPVRFLWVHSASRFLLPFLCLAVPSALLFAGRRRGAVRERGPNLWIARALWAGVIVNAIHFGLPWLTLYDGYGAIVVVAMLVPIGLLSRWAQRRWTHRPTVLLALYGVSTVAFTVGLLAYKDAHRYEFIRDGTVLHFYDRRWWMAAEILDRNVHEQTTIAITSGPALPCIWPSYFFLGRHLQNQLVYVSPLPDGRLPVFCPSDGWEPQASFDVWLARLRARGIRDIVTFPHASLELGWMQAHPELFEPVTVDPAQGGYFRLRTP